MKPTPVSTTIRINRQDAEDILVNVSASYTRPTRAYSREDQDDGPEVTDIKATIASHVRDEEGAILFFQKDSIDLTEDEEEEAAQKITNEQCASH